MHCGGEAGQKFACGEDVQSLIAEMTINMQEEKHGGKTSNDNNAEEELFEENGFSWWENMPKFMDV
jgi:hypothetical protein